MKILEEISKSKNADLIWFSFGLVFGLVISNQFGDLVDFIISVSILYSIAMLGCRIFICWLIHDSFSIGYAKRYGLTLENISMEYNIWNNVMTIKRDIAGKLSTSKDDIDTRCKKIFYNYLFWDVLYHAHPIKIMYI